MSIVPVLSTPTREKKPFDLTSLDLTSLRFRESTQAGFRRNCDNKLNKSEIGKTNFCRKSRPGPEPSDRVRKSSRTGRGLPVNRSTPIETAFETVLNRLRNRFKPFAGTKGSKYYCPLFCACSCACADTCDCPPKFPHQRGNATEPGTTKHLGEHKGI